MIPRNESPKTNLSKMFSLWKNNIYAYLFGLRSQQERQQLAMTPIVEHIIEERYPEESYQPSTMLNILFWIENKQTS